MPQLDAPTFPSLPDLGRVLTSWLEHADLCEVFRKRAQVVGLSASAALPRCAAVGTSSTWLLGTHALCELVSRTRLGARAFYVAVPVDQAAGLADRVLGGSGQPGIAAGVGALSDAECGVLAYLAARACAACGDALAVRDVFCADAHRLGELCANGAFWPVRLSARDLTLDAKILFCARTECPDGQYALALSVWDQLAPETLEGLEPGDLLASDGWPLTASVRGLEARVELSVAGVTERLQAALSGTLLQVSGSLPARALTSEAELLLGELPVSFWQLAQLTSIGRMELPAATLQKALLRVGLRPHATGPLVRVRGTVALRIHSLLTRDSMR